jgi:hypothetical protein
MYTIDDPMFALILRFIGHNKKITLCDNNFIQEQLKSIQEHVEKFSPEEKGLRAIEWIEKYAYEYRKRWEKEVIDKELSDQTCPDCPLSSTNTLEHCQIHEQWQELLQQYAADEINSRKYIENTLQLLSRHKEDLKFKMNMLQEKE